MENRHFTNKIVLTGAVHILALSSFVVVYNMFYACITSCCSTYLKPWRLASPPFALSPRSVCSASNAPYGRAAASSCDSCMGLRATHAAGITRYSHKLPECQGGMAPHTWQHKNICPHISISETTTLQLKHHFLPSRRWRHQRWPFLTTTGGSLAPV